MDLRSRVSLISFDKLLVDFSEIKPVMIPLPAVFGEAVTETVVATIAAKSLPGDIPEEEMETTSTSYRLVARRDVDRATVNTFLQVLFSQRIALARESQLAWQMKGSRTKEPHSQNCQIIAAHSITTIESSRHSWISMGTGFG